MTKKIIILMVLGALFLPIQASQAQTEARSYYYDKIKTEIMLNPDTTFDVTETQTYYFKGTYNQGWRSIPLKKVSNINNVEVFDGQTGKPLVHSFRRLNKLSPGSWDKYTYFQQNGNLNIEWYYNATDVTRIWIIKYKIQGGLTFNKNNDQLYWNIFSDYDVPVKQAQAVINLPQNYPEEKIHFTAYRSNTEKNSQTSFIYEGTKLFINGFDFAPGEAFTIDLDWPTGAVDRTAFWINLAKQNYGFIVGFIIILISFISILIYWLKTEVWLTGRGTVIPIYEPPQNLTPAQMQVILKEKTDEKGLPATIVDLANKGFLTIEENPGNKILKKIAGSNSLIIKLIILGLLLNISVLPFLTRYFHLNFNTATIWLYGYFFILIFFRLRILSYLDKSDYRLYPTEKFIKYKDSSELKPYELKLLKALVEGRVCFSTKEARKWSGTAKMNLTREIKKVKKEILKNTEEETLAFAKPPSKEIYKQIAFVVIFVFGFFVSQLMIKIGGVPQWTYIILTILISLSAFIFFVKFETALNQKGRELKEEILGFKLFLYTAERYRMQNLTPEMFEKYLPYAIAFGIEKYWAKAFKEINMTEPNWYHNSNFVGSATIGGTPNFSAGNFSASVFSASFVSSFSSAFNNSGAGGTSGGGAGGGSAGGGGGGGGGGAS